MSPGQGPGLQPPPGRGAQSPPAPLQEPRHSLIGARTPSAPCHPSGKLLISLCGEEGMEVSAGRPDDKPAPTGGLAGSRPLSSDRPGAQVSLQARGALRLRYGSRQQICQSPLFQEAWQGRDQGRGHPGTLWTLGLPGERKTQYPEVRRFQKVLADLRADASPHLGGPPKKFTGLSEM